MGDNIIIEMIGEIELRRMHHDSENCVFSTPNKYLNNKIYNRLIPHPGTTFLVSRYFLVANQLISLELYDNSLYISMKYGVIVTKYRYVTEELILHMISVGKVPPSHECSYIHSIPGEDIEMEFDTHTLILYRVSIYGIALDVLKFGKSINEMIAKYEPLLVSIYYNYIEPIGASNIKYHHKEMIIDMIDRERLTMPKSALN